MKNKETEELDGFFKGLGKYTIMGIMFIILFLVIGLLDAFVISKLWGWFIVPLFDLPSLTMPFAFGLMLFVGLFHSLGNKIKEEDCWCFLKMKLWYKFLALVAGYLTHLWFIA